MAHLPQALKLCNCPRLNPDPEAENSIASPGNALTGDLRNRSPPSLMHDDAAGLLPPGALSAPPKALLDLASPRTSNIFGGLQQFSIVCLQDPGDPGASMKLQMTWFGARALPLR